MAFMHTQVSHGSGVMIVTSIGADTQVGRSRACCRRLRQRRPAHQADEHTDVWTVGAGVTMIIMFALGLYRGQSWTMLFNTAELAIAAIPLALPWLSGGDQLR
jgi:Ca2+-transporting ATPase